MLSDIIVLIIFSLNILLIILTKHQQKTNKTINKITFHLTIDNISQINLLYNQIKPIPNYY